MVKTFFSQFKDSWIQLFDDRKHWTEKPEIGNYKQKFPIKELKENLEYLQNLNNKGIGVYFQPNPSTGRKAEDVTSIDWIYVDMDNGSKDQMNDRILESPIAPDIIVESLRSYHLYWKCKFETKEQFEEVVQGLILFYSGDSAISSINEVLRLPLFYHMKYPNKKYQITLQHINIIGTTYEKMRELYPQPIKKWEKQYNLQNDDLQVVKDIPIKEVLDRFGVKYNKKNEIIEGVETTSAIINTKQNYINRFSGKPPSGSTIDVVMHYANTDIKGAINWLKEEFGLVKPVMKQEIKKIETKQEIKIDFHKNLEKEIKLTWGTEMLDRELTPIDIHHFDVVYGEESSGKSTFTFFVAQQNAKKGNKVLYLSLEMTGENLIEQIARKFSGITKEQHRTKKINEEQKEAFKKKCNELTSEKNLILISITDQTSKSLIEAIKSIKPDLVFIDNFDLITKEPRETGLEKQVRVSKEFMDFTNTEKIPIILLHHTNKGNGEAKMNIRGISAMSGSNKLADSVDNAFGIWRPAKYVKENQDESLKYKTIIRQDKDRDFGQGAYVDIYFYKGAFIDQMPSVKAHEIFGGKFNK